MTVPPPDPEIPRSPTPHPARPTTLPLVASEYRDAAADLPVFDYETQPVEEIRQTLARVYEQVYGSPAAVPKDEVSIPGVDGGPDVRALLYRPPAVTGTRPAVLHIHGGGWIAGTADMMAGFCAGLARRHDAVVLSVDYRLAPEAPFPAPLDDCWAAQTWLFERSDDLDVDPARVALMGDSAGGNLAAALATRSRDEGGPALRGQVLLYPALDDRTATPAAPTDNPNAGEFVITRPYLRSVWRARLGDGDPQPFEQSYLAPGRATSLTGLPPTYIAVGSLDLFAEEDTDYALRLGRAGVPAELHVFDGVFHGFDLVPGAATDRVRSECDAALRRFLAPHRELGSTSAQSSTTPTRTGS